MGEELGSAVALPQPSKTQGVPMSAPKPSNEELTALIVGMLSIYYQPDEDQDVIRLGLAMWRDALSDLPAEALRRAIRDRVRSSSRQRPVPGEIRAAALKLVERPAVNPEPEEPPFGPNKLIDEETKAKMMAMLSTLSRELGDRKIVPGSLQRIFEVTAEVCGVTVADMKGARRSSDLVKARALACIVARDHTGKSFPQIGAALRRDHTTAIHAVAKAEKMLATNAEWVRARAQIERRLADESD